MSIFIQMFIFIWSMTGLTSTGQATTVRNNSTMIERRETKLVGRIQTTKVAIQLCEDRCNGIRSWKSEAYFRASLSCKDDNNPLADITIHKNHTWRTITVIVQNKSSTCRSLICSVSHICSSLNGLDCKPITRRICKRANKAKAPEHVSLTQNNVSLRRIKYIAASSLYTGIIYGHGSHVEDVDRLLSFNISSKMVVREHALAPNKKQTRVIKVTVLACGMATGPCYTGNGACVYICYRLKNRLINFRLRVFSEPDIENTQVQINCKFVKLSNTRIIVSIAMDNRCVLYILSLLGPQASIKQIKITANSKVYIKPKVIRELSLIQKPWFLDITKNGSHMLLGINSRLYLVSSGHVINNQVTYKDLTLLKETVVNKSELCLLGGGHKIAFIATKFPFRVRKVSVN